MKKIVRGYQDMRRGYEYYVGRAFQYVHHPIFSYRAKKYLTFAENKIDYFIVFYLDKTRDKNKARYKGLVSRLLEKLKDTRTKISKLQEAIK